MFIMGCPGGKINMAAVSAKWSMAHDAQCKARRYAQNVKRNIKEENLNYGLNYGLVV